MRKLYEAMFIVDANKAKDGYEKLQEECLSCITRHGGEVVKAVKWDERRLTYEIEKAKRGVYILVHFNGEPESVGKIERQCQMSETVLRVLILRDVDGIETDTGSSRERAERELGEGEEEPAGVESGKED